MKFKQWVSKDEFESTVLQSKEPKIAVFAASWCGFCKRFVEALKRYNPQNNYSGEAAVIDTDSGDGSLWDKYHIDIVPTIIVFQEGRELFRADGRPMQGLSISDMESAVASAS